MPIEIDEELTWDEAQADPFKLMEARGIVPNCNRSTKGFWNVVAAVLPDRFKDVQAAKDWGRTLTVESVNKIYTISKSHRERFIPALIRLKGSRYRVPVLINPRGEDPKQFIETLVGPLDYFELIEPKPTGKIDIGLPPIDNQSVQDRPIDPKLPVLVVSNPEPDPLPEQGNYEEDISPHETPEETYQRVIAGMNPMAWLDPEAAGLEAARLWLVERRRLHGESLLDNSAQLIDTTPQPHKRKDEL